MYSKWKNSFEDFYSYITANLGNRPSKKHSLDRRNNQKGYFPNNLRWATYIEQQRNTTRNIHITYKGVTLLLKEWSEKIKMPYHILLGRYRLKWPVENMLTKPTKLKASGVVITPDLSWLIV